jgi:hypothetical protein
MRFVPRSMEQISVMLLVARSFSFNCRPVSIHGDISETFDHPIPKSP